MLSVLQINSLPTTSPYGGEVSGLFPMASLLGHSCVPNTKTKYQVNIVKLKILLI